MNELSFAPASERNKRPILGQLLDLLPDHGVLLEIGAGTGQHAVFLAPRFPGLKWQTSECASEWPGLAARLGQQGATNLPPPLELNVLCDEWPDCRFNAVYSSNTAHIMSWEAVCAMFVGTGCCLLPGGCFCLYGPFNRDGKFTAPSNESFDQQLRARDPAMGLRDIAALATLARGQQMMLEDQIGMPANNFLLVFRKA